MHLKYETFIFIFGLILLYQFGASAALVGYAQTILGKITMLTAIFVLAQYDLIMGLALTVFYLALIEYNYTRESFIDPPDNEETGELIFTEEDIMQKPIMQKPIMQKPKKNNLNITSGKELITQEEKLRPNENVKKMISTINAYDDNDMDDNDNSNNLGDFNPPPPGVLSKTKDEVKMANASAAAGTADIITKLPLYVSDNMSKHGNDGLGGANMPTPFHGPEAFTNALPDTYSKDYFKQYVPYYNNMSQSQGNKDILLEKLNYMIHLLEEQQEVKTGHVMEEIILYSFLGIFLIFIVDSFARAGKYVR